MSDFDRGPVKVDLDLSATNEQLRRIEIELDQLNYQFNDMIEIFKRFLERLDILISTQEGGKS